MDKTPTKYLACVFMALTSLSACSLNTENAGGSITKVQQEKLTIANISSYNVSFYSGGTISEFVRVLNATGVKTTSALSLKNLRYTGPTLTSVNSLTAIEIVLGNAVLDFELTTVGINVIASRYHQIPVKSRMEQSDWIRMTNEANVYLSRFHDGQQLSIGSALDDRASHSLFVYAPYTARQKVVNYVASFVSATSNKQRENDSRVDNSQNVITGVLPPPPKF